jgi:NAD/NADP octopine/nopaline dehydrogenase, alpha-helical domain
MQVTVCGGGNAAHALVGLLAARGGHLVNVYLSFEGEALRWQAGIASQGGIEVLQRHATSLGCPQVVSSDPSKVLPGSQLVLLALPAFAHQAVLKQVAPYLDDGAWLGAIPARGAFDLCAWDALGEKCFSLTLFGLQSLPWACRIHEYGRSVKILGTKARLDLAAWPAVRAATVAQQLGELIGIRLDPAATFLSLTLAGTGQLIHPGILYGRFQDWDGRPLAEAPLFYQGVDARTTAVLEQMSAEVQHLRRTLQGRFPSLDLSAVRPLAEWLQRSYPDDILDPSSLQAMFNTNRSYAGLRVPMLPQTGGQPSARTPSARQQSEGPPSARTPSAGLLPDFRSRYLSEDVPYGLVATRGIAELAGVATPVIDRVLLWAQARLDQEYLLAGKLRGRNLMATRAPQRYGLHSLEQLADRIGLPA